MINKVKMIVKRNNKLLNSNLQYKKLNKNKIIMLLK